MTHYRRTVTSSEKNTERLPDWAAAGTALLLDLIRREQLAEVSERLKIRREGGYAGIDVFVFLVYYFASGLRTGLKPFWYRARDFSTQLAAVAGRRQLPSSTAMSRALKAVESESLRAQTPWLLNQATGIERVLAHPAAQSYDAQGHGWHVFDYDPTVTTLRQRALPKGEDLPEAHRRSITMAPGYSGRKRGNVQLRRATLGHSSGAWLFAQDNPGNGERRSELMGALGVVVDTCIQLKHPLKRTLVRADGEYGGVPQLSAFIEHGVHYLTRLSRPALLNDPELRRRLVEAQWELVPDSKSGPQRSAADIGMVTLKPSSKTQQDDGSAYDPVCTRVVVSRFPREKKAGRGKVISGWQYELFGTSLEPVSWPAAEVIASYYGRTGIENRFAQEDRELMLDRIFSYHLPGQELATVVGLMLWNSRIALGFDLAPPPWEKPKQCERIVQLDPRPVSPETCEVEANTKGKGAADIIERKVLVTNPLHKAEAKLAGMLDKLNWEHMLAKREGWRWDAETGLLYCPDGRGLVLTCVDVRHAPRHRARIIFRGEDACQDCEQLGKCFTTTKKLMKKHTSFTVDRAKVAAVKKQLVVVQDLRKERSKELAVKSNTSTKTALEALIPLDATSVDTLFTCLPSLFLPAAARHLFDTQIRDLTTYIRLTLPPAPIPHPALLARSEADRQHRRLTWTQHRHRYILPDGADVDITFAGARQLVRLLRNEGPAGQAVSA